MKNRNTNILDMLILGKKITRKHTECNSNKDEEAIIRSSWTPKYEH
jgi:hypothetical protein